MQKVRGWNDKFTACLFCKTMRRDRLYRGFCVRCYPLIRKIERIDKGLYRRRGRYTNRVGSYYIKHKAYLELRDIAVLEIPLNHEVSGHHIEGLLVTLAEASGSDSDYVYGDHYTFDSFEENTRSRIYRALLAIVELLPSRDARRIYAHRPFGFRRIHYEMETIELEALYRMLPEFPPSISHDSRQAFSL